MRLTVNLDPEVYSFASAYAGANGITLSRAISELLRRAEAAPMPHIDSAKVAESPYGYLVITGTGVQVTPDVVKDSSEDEIG